MHKLLVAGAAAGVLIASPAAAQVGIYVGPSAYAPSAYYGGYYGSGYGYGQPYARAYGYEPGYASGYAWGPTYQAPYGGYSSALAARRYKGGPKYDW